MAEPSIAMSRFSRADAREADGFSRAALGADGERGAGKEAADVIGEAQRGSERARVRSFDAHGSGGDDHERVVEVEHDLFRRRSSLPRFPTCIAVDKSRRGAAFQERREFR